MLKVKCPKCATGLRIYESEAGTVVVCPQCGKKLRIPGAKPAPAEESEEEGVQAPPPKTRPEPPVREAPPQRESSPPLPIDDVEEIEEPAVPRPAASPKKLPRFDTEPYQVRSGASSIGALILIGMTFPAAILCGFLLSFIGQWFYLILIFPCLAGAGVVGIGFCGIQAGKVHSPNVAGIVGALAGSLTMLAMHFFDYQRFLGIFQAQAPGIPAPGLFQFIDIRAQLGVVIAGKGGGQGLNLGYVGSYIYYAVEFLCVVGVCCGGILSFARAPFCTDCNTWKKERTLGGFTLPVAGKSKETCDATVEAFSEGQVIRLVNEDPDWKGETVAFVLTAWECLNCGEEVPVDVALKCQTKDKEGKPTLLELAKVTYPAEAVPVLERLCAKDEGTDEVVEVVEEK